MTKRALIQSKFGNRCAYCGGRLEYKDLTLDHVVPKSKGGDKMEENLFPACRRCNELKASMPMGDFREVLGVELFWFELKARRERDIIEKWKVISNIPSKLNQEGK